jgi:VWFA-related protein
MQSCRFPTLVIALSAFLACSLPAQTTATPDTETSAATLKLNVRTVLIDLVVTDKNDRAVPGLQKEDFQVFEDGKPQSISFFESSFAGSSEATKTGTSQPLPPNTFTNVPTVAPNNVVNVLLMDSLNTPVADQAYSHKQMVRYLGSIPPGIRIAVFMLSEKLRIIQGFTQDSAVLRASIKRLAANPSESALLPTPASAAGQSTAVNLIEQQAASSGSPELAATAVALQQFMDQENGFEANEQMIMTLDALQQIARYLSGVPGRKNLMWFVGVVPQCLAAMTSETEFTNGGCPYEEKYKKTLDMLADSRVSLYPIAAGGLTTDSIYDPGGPGIPENLGSSGSSTVPGGPSTPAVAPFSVLNANQVTAMQSDFQQRSENQTSMDAIARDTGGRATYNNNGIKNALAADIENGSRYYTLAYTPSDRKEVGKERKIEIRSVSGNYKLSYRRSYYEETPKELRAAEKAPATDPLRPLMDRGMPDFTELRYRMKVAPATPQPAANATRAGDNPALSPPLSRYTVSFSLSTDGLSLIPGPDGVRRATVEVALVAYSQRGNPLNWVTRSIGLAIRPEQNAQALATGIPFHFDIDAPPGDVYLRTGIYDTSSSRAGTLEIPLTSVTVAQR